MIIRLSKFGSSKSSGLQCRRAFIPVVPPLTQRARGSSESTSPSDPAPTGPQISASNHAAATRNAPLNVSNYNADEFLRVNTGLAAPSVQLSDQITSASAWFGHYIAQNKYREGAKVHGPLFLPINICFDRCDERREDDEGALSAAPPGPLARSAPARQMRNGHIQPRTVAARSLNGRTESGPFKYGPFSRDARRKHLHKLGDPLSVIVARCR